MEPTAGVEQRGALRCEAARGLAGAKHDGQQFDEGPAGEARAGELGRPVLLEVNVAPANEPSLAFHGARGYEPVGELEHPGPKVVRMFAKHPSRSPHT